MAQPVPYAAAAPAAGAVPGGEVEMPVYRPSISTSRVASPDETIANERLSRNHPLAVAASTYLTGPQPPKEPTEGEPTPAKLRKDSREYIKKAGDVLSKQSARTATKNAVGVLEALDARAIRNEAVRAATAIALGHRHALVGDIYARSLIVPDDDDDAAAPRGIAGLPGVIPDGEFRNSPDNAAAPHRGAHAARVRRATDDADLGGVALGRRIVLAISAIEPDSRQHPPRDHNLGRVLAGRIDEKIERYRGLRGD